VHLLVLDFELYFVTLLPIDTGMDSWGEESLNSGLHSIFFNIPYGDESVDRYYVWLAAKIWMVQLVLLILGICPRFNAIGNFFWHVQFHHHNNILFDGSDIMIRLMAFFLIFLPLHRHTIWDVIAYLWSRFNGKAKTNKKASSTATPHNNIDTWPMWPFRLIQIEMCLQFFSCVMVKWAGPMWRDGSAMYYVVHMPDFFGKGLLTPNVLFGYLGSLRILTWMTLLVETVAPVTIWFESTRKMTLWMLISFHVGVDLSMNLNFFHWIMIVGWCAFFAQPMTREEYRKMVVAEEEEEETRENSTTTKTNTNIVETEGIGHFTKKIAGGADAKAKEVDKAAALAKKEMRFGEAKSIEISRESPTKKWKVFRRGNKGKKKKL